MSDTVVASRTEMERDINQTFRTFEYEFHVTSSARKAHRAESIGKLK
jgi:hypothetical protein